METTPKLNLSGCTVKSDKKSDVITMNLKQAMLLTLQTNLPEQKDADGNAIPIKLAVQGGKWKDTSNGNRRIVYFGDANRGVIESFNHNCFSICTSESSEIEAGDKVNPFTKVIYNPQNCCFYTCSNSNDEDLIIE